jgi:hypothetical protein
LVTALWTFYEKRENSVIYELPLPLIDWFVAAIACDDTDPIIVSSILKIFTYITATTKRTPAVDHLLCSLDWESSAVFKDGDRLWLMGNLFEWLSCVFQTSIVSTLIPELPRLLRVPDLSHSAVHLLQNVCLHYHLSHLAVVSLRDTIVSFGMALPGADEEIVAELIHIVHKGVVKKKWWKLFFGDPRILALCHRLLDSPSEDAVCAAVSLFAAFAFRHKGPGAELSDRIDFAKIIAAAGRFPSELLLQVVFDCLLNAFYHDAVPSNDEVLDSLNSLLWRAVNSDESRTLFRALLLYNNIVPRRDLPERVRMLTSPLFAALLPAVEATSAADQVQILGNISWAVKKTEAEGIGRELCAFLADGREMFERILGQAESREQRQDAGGEAEKLAVYCRNLLEILEEYASS